MRRICRTAGHGSQKYAIELSLITVAIGGTGFITEALLAVEYIQATRLALIRAHPGVAFILSLMSFVKCKFTIFLFLSYTIHKLYIMYTARRIHSSSGRDYTISEDRILSANDRKLFSSDRITLSDRYITTNGCCNIRI